MASPLPPTTTGTSPTFVANMTTLASHAFATDGFPVMVLRERDNLTTVTRGNLAHHYSEHINAKIHASTVIIEAGNWAAAAVCEPPKPPSDSAVSSPETAVMKNDNEVPTTEAKTVPRSPVLEDFITRSNLAKHTHLGLRSSYYLSLHGAIHRTPVAPQKAPCEPFWNPL